MVTVNLSTHNTRNDFVEVFTGETLEDALQLVVDAIHDWQSYHFENHPRFSELDETAEVGSGYVWWSDYTKLDAGTVPYWERAEDFEGDAEPDGYFHAEPLALTVENVREFAQDAMDATVSLKVL